MDDLCETLFQESQRLDEEDEEDPKNENVEANEIPPGNSYQNEFEQHLAAKGIDVNQKCLLENPMTQCSQVEPSSQDDLESCLNLYAIAKSHVTEVQLPENLLNMKGSMRTIKVASNLPKQADKTPTFFTNAPMPLLIRDIRRIRIEKDSSLIKIRELYDRRFKFVMFFGMCQIGPKAWSQESSTYYIDDGSDRIKIYFKHSPTGIKSKQTESFIVIIFLFQID